MSLHFVRDCWFLTGPTASGKSAAGVELARRIDAEIVSLDSMALYRRMDIGTAKPTAEQRRAVTHHLVDAIEPWEEFSLARYVEEAARAAAEIAGRGRQALFVGGTPLYLKGLLRGIFEGPPADWELRRRLVDEARTRGGDWLHRRLAEVDPATAARLHPNDERRLIRALEVFEKTGRPISELQRQFEVGRTTEECRVFVLDWPREELYVRIEQRVDEMFAAGLVEEVRRLLAHSPLALSERAGQKNGPLALWERVRVRADDEAHAPHPRPLSQRERGDSLSRTARQAVGYREVIEHLEGRRVLAETVELVKLHTRQLAKRQMTWFRSLSECRFVALSGQCEPTEIAERIISLAVQRLTACVPSLFSWGAFLLEYLGMKTYAFEVILSPVTEVTEELADQLFEAGCDDGTPGTFCGSPRVSFHREADNLESAIRSAVADIQKTGCVVERVQIEHDSPLLSSDAG